MKPPDNTLVSAKAGGLRPAVDNAGWLGATLILAAFIITWESVVRIANVPEYLVPSPTRILITVLEKRISLAFDFGTTLLESVLGFLLANALSLLVAIGFFYSRAAERSILPMLVGLKSVPIVAMAPLLVLWFGYGLLILLC